MALLIFMLMSVFGIPARAGSPSPNYFKSLAAGQYHTCALTFGGQVICWGHDHGSQVGVMGWSTALGIKESTVTDNNIGDDTFGLSYGAYFDRPVKVKISGVQAIAAGDQFTCAIDGTGAVECWGENPMAPTPAGVDPTTGLITPAKVPGLIAAAKAIAAGDDFACALLVTGQVQCWGSFLNDYFQLGLTNPLPSTWVMGTAYLVPGISNAFAIAAGQNHYVLDGGSAHVCVLENTKMLGYNFTVYNAQQPVCWGDNYFGELGVPIPQATMWADSQLELDQLSYNLTDGTAIAATGKSTCGISASQGVLCWGDNSQGELATWQNLCQTACDSAFAIRFGADKPAGPPTAIAGRNDTFCAIYAGSVFCWGNDWHGQLGDDNTANSFFAIKNPEVFNATAIAVGDEHACAIVSGGAYILCWGDNTVGQFGDTQSYPGPALPDYVYTWLVGLGGP